MTDKELKKKAFEYRREVVPETYLGYPDVEIPMYSALDIDRAYLAGAKELQKENEQLKTENEQLKQELLTYKNAICNKECAEVWGESERLKEENEQLKKNGIVWHDLRKNPNDLPKRDGEYLTNIGVLVFDNSFGNSWQTLLCEACDFYEEVSDEVIAWCEIPKFEVEE